MGSDAPASALAAALHASEARFRNTIEKNADGVVVLTQTGIIRFVNPAAEALLGKSAGILVGEMFGVPIIPGETTEVDILHGGAGARVAEIRVVESEWEGEPAYLAALRDVTERKQHAEAMRFLAEASRTLAASLDVPTILTTLARLAVTHLGDWCLIDVVEGVGNREGEAAAAPLDTKKPSAVPASFPRNSPAVDSRQNGRQPIRRAAAAHRDGARQSCMRALEGSWALPAESALGPAAVLLSGRSEIHPQATTALCASLAHCPAARTIVAELGCDAVMVLPLVVRGRTLGAITVVAAGMRRSYGPADLALAEDFASRGALAIDSARLYAQTCDAVRRRDEFLAMLAHELRNPLAPIRTAAALVCEQPMDGTSARWAGQLIGRQVHHLARLVDDLLDVSRLTRGEIKLRKERVELAEVVATAVETSRPFVEDRRHRLEVTVPANAGRLNADPTRLVQVLANLLNNAAKYTEPGGRIRLTVERNGDSALVRVQDNGPGIPPDMLTRVFDLFTQVDSTIERSQGGLGIGLTLVRRLVELHGGEVWAFSQGRGQGSEFVVRLPLLEERVAARAPCAQSPAGAGKVTTLRILVVDDNRDAAESLALLLKLLGHETHSAFDGPQALDAARAAAPNVIFCDIGLPGMSGYKVASQLRSTPGFEKVLLVAVTGFGSGSDRMQSRDAGFDHHLVKPVAPEEITKVLGSVTTGV